MWSSVTDFKGHPCCIMYEHIIHFDCLIVSHHMVIWFFCSLVDGHLSCFHFLAVMNNAALNIYIHDFTLRYMYSFSIPRNGTFGHMATLCLTFWGLPNCFPIDCTILYSHYIGYVIWNLRDILLKKKKFSYPLFPALLDIMFTGMSYYLKFWKVIEFESWRDSSGFIFLPERKVPEVQAFCSMLLLLWDQCHKIVGAQYIFLNEWIFSVTFVLMRKMMLRKVRWLPKGHRLNWRNNGWNTSLNFLAKILPSQSAWIHNSYCAWWSMADLVQHFLTVL